jgi:hypothetical protein
MTQDEIIEMAKSINEDWWLDDIDLQDFARLVAEKERERMTVVAMNAAEKAVDVAMKLEREACAKLLERTDLGGLKSDVWLQNYTATILDGYTKAIRAREQA